MSENLAQFLDCVSRSGLICRSRLDRESRLHTSTAGGSPEQFAVRLVQCGLLTEWQAENLLNRRHQGFFLGNIRILNVLRSNALMRVCLGEDQSLNRRVAVQVLLPRHNTDTQTVERFQRSIRGLARMTHPNISRVLTVQADAGLSYAVIEHFDGETLASLVARIGPLDLDLATRLLLQMAHAVQHSHQRRLILCALDPATILVDGEGRLKLDSIAWARHLDDDPWAASLAPLPRMAAECRHFLSPESVLPSVDACESTDTYSLGCVFYFMLAGRPPFAGQTIANVLLSHQTSQPPSLRELRDDLPETVLQICARMMAKKPCQRLGTQQAIDLLNESLTRN